MRPGSQARPPRESAGGLPAHHRPPRSARYRDGARHSRYRGDVSFPGGWPWCCSAESAGRNPAFRRPLECARLLARSMYLPPEEHAMARFLDRRGDRLTGFRARGFEPASSRGPNRPCAHAQQPVAVSDRDAYDQRRGSMRRCPDIAARLSGLLPCCRPGGGVRSAKGVR